MSAIEIKPHFKLRSYQQDAVRAVLLPHPKSGNIIAPCGSGKTFIVASIIKSLGRNTLYITTNKSLVSQVVKTLSDCLTANVGPLAAQSTARTKNTILVATYTALSSRKKRSEISRRVIRWLVRVFKPRLVVFDEAHRVPAVTFQGISDMFDGSPLKIGMSATFVRKDRNMAPIREGIGPVLYRIRLKRLIREGWLPHLSLVDVILTRNIDSCKSLQTSLMNAARLFVDRLQKRQMQCVVYVDDIPMLLRLKKEFAWSAIYGSMPETQKKHTLEKFRRKQIMCLMVSEVGDEGLDFEAHVGIAITRQGPVWQKVQRVGRTMRSRYRDPVTDQKIAWYIAICAATGSDAEKNTEQNMQLYEEGLHPRILMIDEDLTKP
jgi:DNA excision repair protein ERCC-3